MIIISLMIKDEEKLFHHLSLSLSQLNSCYNQFQSISKSNMNQYELNINSLGDLSPMIPIDIFMIVITINTLVTI